MPGNRTTGLPASGLTILRLQLGRLARKVILHGRWRLPWNLANRLTHVFF